MSIGIDWWFNQTSARAAAHLRSHRARRAGPVLAPQVSDFDRVCVQTGIAVATNFATVPVGQRPTDWLAERLENLKRASVIFIDPDTGIGKGSPAVRYIRPREVAEVARSHHALIYHHRPREGAERTKQRVDGLLKAVGLHGMEYLDRPRTECVFVWIPNQSSPRPFPWSLLPVGLWRRL
jgi:hypothetical protein